MDYEKMYKAVLKTATQWIKDGCSDKEKICLESVFPELRESEDERIRKFLVDYFTSYKIGNVATKLNGVRIDDILAYLEKQKEEKPVVTHGETYHVDTLGTQQVIAGKMPQKPAEWSEEDSDNLERVDNYLWMLDNYVGDDCATPQKKADKIRENIQKVLSPWLKSLPERFNPQPKQEWDTHDKAIVGCIACCLDGQFVTEAARKQCLEWFNKHRRDFLNRPSWKPSENQMSMLLAVVNDPNNAGSESCHLSLESLYYDLKKL